MSRPSIVSLAATVIIGSACIVTTSNDASAYSSSGIPIYQPGAYRGSLYRDGGYRGIRTRDRALQPYNGLANRRLQPLGHSSVIDFSQRFRSFEVR
jgi:hypothetical protein